jgi:O-antigen biosynthesis protein
MKKMSMTNKILSIVIPVFNKVNFTKSCLNDLLKLPDNHEIIVVNNASSDETSAVLSDFGKNYSNIIIVDNPQNLGFAKACNIGFGYAEAPNIMFLNNDIRVKSNHDSWTKEIIEKCSYGLVGPTMGQLDKNLNFVKEANQLLDGNSYMSGWCLATSREIWSKFWIPRKETIVETVNQSIPQIFSEEFGLAYFEDTDLGFRARRLDIPFQVVSIPVVHFGKQTSSQLNTHALYQHAKNIFIKKWSKK